MRKALAFGIVAVLLVPSSASARGGYLHLARARTAADHYARAHVRGLGATSGGLNSCTRHAGRIIACSVHYTGIAVTGEAWELYEVVVVELRHGTVVVQSRLFRS